MKPITKMVDGGMYSTMPPEVLIIDNIDEYIWDKMNELPDEPVDYDDFDPDFLDNEDKELEELLKYEPERR